MTEFLEQKRVRVSEAARLLGKDRRTLNRWIRAGKLAAERIGRWRYVRLVDVEAVVEPVRPEKRTPRRVAKRAWEKQKEKVLARFKQKKG